MSDFNLFEVVMSKIFYRFRKVDNLIGSRKELQKGYVYFSDPESLNDPMEGYREIVWEGDEIIWRNLFRHYFSCLSENIFESMIRDNDYNVKITVFNDVLASFNDVHKRKKEILVSRFINDESVKKIISMISKRKMAISKSELHFYLSLVHYYAFSLAYSEVDKDYASADNSKSILTKFVNSNWEQEINDFENNDEGRLKTKKLLQAKDCVNTQMNILQLLKGKINIENKVKYAIFISYPSDYLKALEDLMFPKWYTACFMSTCTDSSVWGNYGDNHKGVCLIYESEEENEKSCLSLNIRNEYSSNGPTYGIGKLEFNKVDYVHGYEDINFFENLGTLPLPILYSNWYSDGNGKLSSCADLVRNDEDAWRRKYWEGFYSDLMKKTKDWHYENEYRLILNGGMHNYEKNTSRNIEYSFNSLKGLIFGIKTSLEDKVNIIKIINKKCEENERYDFCFYQAYYDDITKKIDHYPMQVINGFLRKIDG